MSSRIPNTNELKKIIIKRLKKLDKGDLATLCLVQLEAHEPPLKIITESEKAKAEGNRLYGQKDATFTRLYEILVLYNKSIAFAPNDSKELATAYANKSAVLLRMRMYNECITEIDKALKITELMNLKVKLLCRKAASLTALGSSDNRGCLEKARFIIAKLEDTDKVKKCLSKLIEETQSTLDEDKLDIPKEDKRITQSMDTIREAEKRDVLESIRVEYSEKYGKHLVAARDYKPGEIILTEKPYLNSLDESRTYQYCDYCFAHLWTAVPCDNCARHVYCSENCKTLAWNEYHEINCFALACMSASFRAQWIAYIPFVVDFFCKALKEAGSLKQLLAGSKSSHQTKGQGDNNNSSTPSSTSYKGTLTLSTDAEETKLDVCTTVSIIALVGLAKYTKIFGKTYHFSDMNKLMKDETVIQAGALLLKFGILLGIGFDLLPLIDPTKINDYFEKHDEPSYANKNSSIPILIMHAMTGCIPNVESYFTHGNKFVLCALQPIKAGEKLMQTMDVVTGIMPKSERQVQHIGIYGCPCECKSCTEDWSHTLTDRALYSRLLLAETHRPASSKLWDEMNSILSDWQSNSHKPSYPDIKILSRAVDLVSTAFKLLPMPSPLVAKCVGSLSVILRGFYDRSEMYAKLPRLRPPKLGHVVVHSDFCSCGRQ